MCCGSGIVEVKCPYKHRGSIVGEYVYSKDSCFEIETSDINVRARMCTIIRSKHICKFVMFSSATMLARYMLSSCVQWSNYRKVFRGPYGERGARAYNGGLGQNLN